VLPLGDGHERAPERHALHERPRAVDRVHEPAPARARPGLAELLAEDAVLREVALDPRAHDLLGVAIGARHRRAVGFRLHVEPAAEVLHRLGARERRHLAHRIEQPRAHRPTRLRRVPRFRAGRAPAL
jgi:hypothetical protein